MPKKLKKFNVIFTATVEYSVEVEAASEKDVTRLVTWDAKYKLLSGEGVEFHDLPKDLQEQAGGGLFGRNKDRARTKIHIDGDNMTMTDDDGKSGKLVRIK